MFVFSFRLKKHNEDEDERLDIIFMRERTEALNRGSQGMGVNPK